MDLVSTYRRRRQSVNCARTTPLVKYLQMANYEKSNGIVGQQQEQTIWSCVSTGAWKPNDEAKDRQQIAVGVSETGAYTSMTEEYWQWSGVQITYRSHAINVDYVLHNAEVTIL